MPMDMTIVLGLHKFSLYASHDHHGPSMYSGHYTTSVNFRKEKLYYKTAKFLKCLKFEVSDTQTSSTVYVVMYTSIT